MKSLLAKCRTVTRIDKSRYSILEFQQRATSVSYCAYVREDNPQALASGLSPVHTHNHTKTYLLHQHACALCTLSGLSPVHTHNHTITYLLHQHACALCTLSGLSPVHTHNHTITYLLHQHACGTLYIVRYLMYNIWISLKDAIYVT